MKKEFINTTHIEGYVYEHKLSERVSGPDSKTPGTPFINGSLSIATDDTLMNVIQVYFSYVTPTTKKGGANPTYNLLKSVIDGGIGVVMKDGIDKAGMVRIDSAIGLNEWYDNDDKLVSVKRNEGGFVHSTNSLNDDLAARSSFETDIIITNCIRQEADIEKNTPEKMILKGTIFAFNNALLPVEYVVYHTGAMDYFESLGISPQTPVFTKVSGVQVSQTIVKKTEEESAFGSIKVKETKSSVREFVVTWAAPSTYAWDDEGSILVSELNELMAAREVRKAEIKKRQDEFKTKKTATPAPSAFTPTATPTTGSVYNF